MKLLTMVVEDVGHSLRTLTVIVDTDEPHAFIHEFHHCCVFVGVVFKVTLQANEIHTLRLVALSFVGT